MICPSCGTSFNGAKGSCFSCGSEIEKGPLIKKEIKKEKPEPIPEKEKVSTKKK